MVLTAYVVLSPVTGLFCHRRPRIGDLSAPGRADLPSRELDASVGASGPHDFAVREKRLSSACRGIAHGFLRTRPAIPSRAKRRRVHRIPPRVRDDHDTPLLWGGMAKVLEVIWGVRKRKYFCKGDSTRQSTNGPTGKSPHGGESIFRSCPLCGAAPSGAR